MAKRLYVGNLSYEMSNAELEQLFAQFGPVETAEVIVDRTTGRSKGFGFVEMGTMQAAEDAISALNGKEFGGRPLTVNEAKPREEHGTGLARGDGGGGGGRSRGW